MYYGDEIGMPDNNNIPNDTMTVKITITKMLTKIMSKFQDYRDPERTPMQWNAEDNAGFCEDCTPWLPVNSGYGELNVEVTFGFLLY